MRADTCIELSTGFLGFACKLSECGREGCFGCLVDVSPKIGRIKQLYSYSYLLDHLPRQNIPTTDIFNSPAVSKCGIFTAQTPVNICQMSTTWIKNVPPVGQIRNAHFNLLPLDDSC